VRRLPWIALAAAIAVAHVSSGSAAPPLEPAPIVVAHALEVRGEVVSLDCYLRDGKRGEAHRACALAALAHGGSLALVADDSGDVFLLAGDTPASDPSTAVRDLIAQHVLVSGKLYERARARVLVPSTVQRLD
jgi:hypothetical protein